MIGAQMQHLVGLRACPTVAGQSVTTLLHGGANKVRKVLRNVSLVFSVAHISTVAEDEITAFAFRPANQSSLSPGCRIWVATVETRTELLCATLGFSAACGGIPVFDELEGITCACGLGAVSWITAFLIALTEESKSLVLHGREI